jgi:hypothetical protein
MLQTLWLLLLLSVALPLLLLFYLPALLMAALARPVLGIKSEAKKRIERLQQACGWIWGAALTLYVLLTQ